MKSSTVTRKPKKLAMPELQASMAKKKTYRGGMHPGMMIPGQEAVAMSDLLLPAAAAAAAQGLPIRLPDVNATQVHHSCAHYFFSMLREQRKSCQNMSAKQSTCSDALLSNLYQHSSPVQSCSTYLSMLCCLFPCLSAFCISSMSRYSHGQQCGSSDAVRCMYMCVHYQASFLPPHSHV